jgi:hypothetical protein
MPNKAISFREFARYNNQRLLKTQKLVEQNQKRFGVTVQSFAKRKYFKGLNQDALHVQIEQLILSSKRGLQGLKSRFIELIEDLGYETSAAQAVAGPTGLTASAITTTTATADWADYAGATGYDLYVYNAAGTTLLQTHKGVSVSQKALTGLTINTTYTLRVRAVWDAGTQFTKLSEATFATAAA